MFASVQGRDLGSVGKAIQKIVDANKKDLPRGSFLRVRGQIETMNSSYIESVWWALKQIFDQGLLVESHRVAPYCPRCGTTLSDHEVAQGYENIVDPSVYCQPSQGSGGAVLE